MPRYAVVIRSYVKIDAENAEEARREIRNFLEEFGNFKFLRAPKGHGGIDILGPVGAREPWGYKTKKHVE